jgi:hypothetical protein
MKKHSTFSRRNFLSSASMLALGGTLMSFKKAQNLIPVPDTDNRRLWDDFTKEEKKLIENSGMAKIIVEIEGGSCAEKVLLTSLRFFDRPDELACFAASFGGGIRHYDLCGMLTGGFMSIGLAADVLFEEKAERSAFVGDATREYWDWWEEHAPCHCYELKPKYSWNPENFNKMAQRVALKLEDMFTL